jgi:signal transduction histidine kinase/ActR/RegA family two-component response regulator
MADSRRRTFSLATLQLATGRKSGSAGQHPGFWRPWLLFGLITVVKRRNTPAKRRTNAAPAVSDGGVAPDFRQVFDSAPGCYLVLAPDLTIVAVTDSYLRATMTVREQILGREIFHVFPDNPDDPGATGVANLRASLERVLRSGRPDAMAVQKYDVRRPHSEGDTFEERYWSPINSPILGADGKVRYIVHRVEDVTEFVRLKKAGTAADELTRDLRARAGQMEAEIYRRAQEIQETNKQLRTLHEELEAKVQERTADLLRANEELQREIAERKKAQEALLRSEEQLRQAQKLEAIGRLAGGVAHDFNNLLSVVLSYSGILLSEMDPKAHGYNELEEIKRAGERAAELTRQLLAFSRQQVLDFKILDLNEILTGLTKMLGRLLGEDVEMKMLLSPRLGRVRADRGQIEQVVMNLAVNARDALPSGGKLTIETANVELDEVYAREHLGVSPGSYVMLAVSDTGVGMDKATQARIFEPFFTTKEKGKGTGLGLSTVFGIVKQSGGNIWLYSEPGGGTTFKVYLPRVEGAVDAPAGAPAAAAQAKGSETILLAEDEDQVRLVASEILKKAGYHVLEARSPGEALLICEQHPVKIHLLLTDVVMPKLSGRQLAERVRSLRPEIRVAFMSGYTDDAILHHGVLDSDVAFIQKPLTPDALTRRVREVLDANPTQARSSRST